MIVGNPAIVLEPQSTNGSATVDLRNDEAKDVTLHLSLSTSEDAGQSAVFTIEGQPQTETTHALTINANSQRRTRFVPMRMQYCKNFRRVIWKNSFAQPSTGTTTHAALSV